MVNDDNKVTYFAQSDSRNKRVTFGIKRKDRSRHMYVIGKTGMGKSTLLENMAIQDIQSGEGLAFIDPHGKTAELLLEYVPEHRIKDVLYFAPFDMEYPISFNVMEDVGPDRRHLVVNGLMSTFEKIWVDSWSARMAYILNNTLLALLEYPGSALLGINRMLSDKEYRKKIVENIKDPSVRSFWVDEFGKYTDKYAAEATPAIQNKVGQFTSNPLIRNIIGQSSSSFDMRKIMDEKKIMIVNLSKGRVGEGNANLLGSMLITKMYLAAMSRADASESALHKLPNFYLYVDEFQSFANKSFADILSEARKYKLNLTIAHQYIEQMEEEVRAAVFGNVGTMVTFRVGAYDAEVLEKEFAPQFTAEDLVNLGVFQIYLKLMIDGVGSSPFSAVTMAPIQKPTVNYKEQVIESSRKIFGAPREKVEEEIRAFHQPTVPTAPKKVEKIETKKVEAPVVSGVATNPAPAQAPVQQIQSAPKVLQATSTPTPPRSPVKPATPQKISYVVGAKPENRPVERRQDREPIKPVEKPPIQQGEPTARPISLSQLKSNDPQKKAKNPGPENLSELRKALSSILNNNQGQTTPKPVVENSIPSISIKPENHHTEKENNHQNHNSVHDKKESHATEEHKPKETKEIPEEVLRNLLKVEGHEQA